MLKHLLQTFHEAQFEREIKDALCAHYGSRKQLLRAHRLTQIEPPDLGGEGPWNVTVSVTLAPYEHLPANVPIEADQHVTEEEHLYWVRLHVIRRWKILYFVLSVQPLDPPEPQAQLHAPSQQ